jgi:hypothetical protein
VSASEHRDFAHRQNSDGTFDSICLVCFQTIATVVRVELLAECEKSHSCYEKKRPQSTDLQSLPKIQNN